MYLEGQGSGESSVIQGPLSVSYTLLGRGQVGRQGVRQEELGDPWASSGRVY